MHYLINSVTYAVPAGYWAFGWSVAPFLVSSFTFPTGLIAAVYVLAIIQIVGCYQIYARPTFGATHAWFWWLALLIIGNEMRLEDALTCTDLRQPFQLAASVTFALRLMGLCRLMLPASILAAVLTLLA